MMFITSLFQNSFLRQIFKKKGAAILLLLFCKLNYVSAQNCVWARSSNDNGYNEGSGVCTDTNGNVYLTGDFSSPIIAFGSNTLANQGYKNVFVAKYDANGNAIWARSGEGISGNDFGYAVNCDKSGNVFACGLYSSPSISFGNYTLTYSAGYDYYIVKYDPNGNVLWARREGEEGDEVLFSLSTDSQGNVYTVGYSTSSVVTIGNYTFANNQSLLFVVKYDGNTGNVKWVRAGNGSGACYAVNIDKKDNVYITGEFYSPTISMGTQTLTRMDSDPDFFVAKLDTAGNCVWTRSGSNRYGYSVCTNASGDVFVLGNYIDSIMTVGTYTFSNPGGGGGGYGNFLVSYDANGNIKWAKGFGCQGSSYAYSIVSDVSNLYITGYFFPFNSFVIDSHTLTPIAGSTDPMYFVRMDFSGNVVYALGLKSGGNGGANQDVGVCADNNGNVYIGSDFNVDPFVVDSKTLTLTGQRDVFLAKFHFNDVGIQENAKEGNNSIIYPNPNNGTFTIKFQEGKQAGRVEINIFDLTGRLISKENRVITNDSEFKIKSDFKDGMYLLKVKFEDGSYDIHHLIISK